MWSDVEMNRGLILAAIALVFFSTWFNSAPTHAGFSEAPESYSKPVVAASNTIWVPDNHTTIQEAVNAAEKGDTIFVKAGTYHEHVVIDKALSLIGENKQDTIINGSGTGTVVHVAAYNITLSNFTIQNGRLGIYLQGSNNNIFDGNIVSNNNMYGIYLRYSGNNALTNNVVSSNNPYGIYLSYSSNNALIGNTASNNSYGIYLSHSGNNAITNNTASNSDNGIHLHSSGNNALTGNDISSSSSYGIHLYHSDGNILSGNFASNNPSGIYVGDSDGNVFAGNYMSNNQYGIYLYYSRGNTLAGDTVSNNSYGIYLQGSSNNAVFHNNFLSNTEPASSINSVNSWDDGIEGNYWSAYDGTDTDLDGIGDTPYYIRESILDNYPLMGMFSQFNITTENQCYIVGTITNSTISDFQCLYDIGTKTDAVSFKVNVTQNNGFWRIFIPHALINPPLTVRVDGNAPFYFKKVYANGTHTWIYFAYDHLEHEITIMQMPPSKQLLFFQWTIFGLAIIAVILFSISVNYYRLLNKQKKIIEAYEREVGSFPVSHEDRARMRFIKDVIERKEKLEKFKKKYGIKIQPASTLEDLMDKLGVQKRS